MATKSKINPPHVETEPEAAKAPPTEAPPTEASEAVEPGDRSSRAQQVVQRNVYWAMGAGVLPLPAIDIVAITGVQLKMLRELSSIYERPFREGVAKKAVASLLTGIGGVSIGSVLGASLLKFIPVIGQSLGVVSVPIISGMLTHAVGRTFIMHFEAGGTVLDFDAKNMREYFKKEYGKAKDVVTEMKNKEEPAQTQASA